MYTYIPSLLSLPPTLPISPLYYSAIKRNEIESFVVMWMDLESVIQSEVSQKEKKRVPYINVYIWNLEK